jgi:predicted transcriptional regulator
VIRQLLTSLNGQLAILCPLSIVQLDLFTHLKDGSMSVEEIARRVDVRADKLKPLLYALAAVRLSTVESGVFPTPVQPIIFLSREMRLIGMESMS